MTDEERELLKLVCGALGALSSALADGVGLYELQQLNAGIQRDIGPLFERVFGPDGSGISIRAQQMAGRLSQTLLNFEGL
jgi:hypothetical protein